MSRKSRKTIKSWNKFCRRIASGKKVKSFPKSLRRLG